LQSAQLDAIMRLVLRLWREDALQMAWQYQVSHAQDGANRLGRHVREKTIQVMVRTVSGHYAQCARQALCAWCAVAVKTHHMGDLKKARMEAQQSTQGWASDLQDVHTSALSLRTLLTWASRVSQTRKERAAEEFRKLTQQVRVKVHVNAIQAATSQLRQRGGMIAMTMFSAWQYCTSTSRHETSAALWRRSLQHGALKGRSSSCGGEARPTKTSWRSAGRAAST